MSFPNGTIIGDGTLYIPLVSFFEIFPSGTFLGGCTSIRDTRVPSNENSYSVQIKIY